MYVKPTILFAEGSDLETAMGLVDFALLQDEILHRLMVFNSLKQDTRKVQMIDGSEIVIKRNHDLSKITISTPARKIIDTETLPEVFFIQIDPGFTPRYVYWYNVYGVLLKQEVIVLEHGVTNADEFFDPNWTGPDGIIGMQLHFVRADLNTVMTRVFPDYPDTSAPADWYDYMYWIKQLPLVPRINVIPTWSWQQWFWQPDLDRWTAIAPNVEKNYIAKSLHLTECGTELIASINNIWWPNGSWSDKYGASVFIIRPSGLQYIAMAVYQAFQEVPGTPPYIGADWELEHIICTCPSSYKGYIFIAVAIFDTSGFMGTPPTWSGSRFYNEGVFKEAFIMSWPVADIDLNTIYAWRENYAAGTGGFLALGTVFKTLTKTEFYQLKQIECYNNKIYLFSDSGQGTRLVPGTEEVADWDDWPDIRQNARVAVYNWELAHRGEYINERVFWELYIDPVTRLDRPVGLRSNITKPVFLIPQRSTPTGGYIHPITIDVDTLATVNTIKLPARQTMVVNRPKTDYMVYKVNEIRAQQPLIDDGGWRWWRRPSVGVSTIASDCAAAHLQWCYNNHDFKHEDGNGDTIEIWGIPYGLYFAGDNLALIDAELQHDEIDHAIDLWVNSPPHFANIINEGAVTIGWASVLLTEAYGEVTFVGVAHTITRPTKVYQLIVALG